MDGKVEAGKFMRFTADTPDPSLHKIFDYWYFKWTEADGSSNGQTESGKTTVSREKLCHFKLTIMLTYIKIVSAIV